MTLYDLIEVVADGKVFVTNIPNFQINPDPRPDPLARLLDILEAFTGLLYEEDGKLYVTDLSLAPPGDKAG